jgi:hypothetical protein
MIRQIRENREAVSTVVASILILAVVTTFITAINAFYIPTLAANNEINHMQAVRNSFMEMASIAASGNSAKKVQVPLGSEGLPFVSTPPSSGSLSVDTKGGWISVNFENVAEPEKRFDGGYIVNDLISVSSLHMVKNETSPLVAYEVVLDADNYISAEFETPSTLLVETVRKGNPVFYHHVAIPYTEGGYFSLDLMNPVFGFAEALEYAQAPYSLTLVDGSFYIEYKKLPPYDYYEQLYTYDESMNMTTGSFRYRSSNNFWINQEFIFENGAVILNQATSTESLVRSKPFITLEEEGKVLNLQLFRIVGIEDSMSGNGVSTVNVKVETKEERTYPFVGKTTLIISSDYPDAWFRYLSTIGEAKMLGDGTVEASFSDMSVKLSRSDVTIMVP